MQHQNCDQTSLEGSLSRVPVLALTGRARAGQRAGIAGSRPRRAQSRGFSLIELLIVVSIILIIAVIAIPKMNSQLMQAREMAAIREIGTIHQAETQYYSQFGHYAGTLAELGPPASGGAGPEAADLLPAALATGTHSGHVYTVTATPTGYAISVVPEQFGSSGRRTFYSDQTLVIRQNWSEEPATAESPELQ